MMASPELSCIADIQRIVTRPGCEARYSSVDLGWTSACAFIQRENPFQASVHPAPHHLLVFHLGAGAHVKARADDTHVRRSVPAGSIYVWPADQAFNISLESWVETMHLYLHRDLFGSETELKPELCVRDTLLLELGTELARLMKSRVGAMDLYVDSLAVAMAERLVSRCVDGRVASRRRGRPGLSPVKLRRVVEYIDSNLQEPIRLSQLCEIANMSPAHFVRQFKATLGQPAHQFVLNRRIELARKLLSHSDQPLVEVALHCGFTHQEHLTNVFRRLVGIAPGAYRRSANSPGW
ncbi:AraC family transcriptional regulator [Paraburkholderia xenovorans]|uniref:helix-turn-helix domain-containing protein n=1 Tax=Paraburkholderia xenovorans TaxID=36873 RepID=UPI0038B86405